MSEEPTEEYLSAVERRLLERAYRSGRAHYNLFDPLESKAVSMLNARKLAVTRRDAGYPVIDITPAGREVLKDSAHDR